MDPFGRSIGSYASIVLYLLQQSWSRGGHVGRQASERAPGEREPTLFLHHDGLTAEQSRALRWRAR